MSENPHAAQIRKALLDPWGWGAGRGGPMKYRAPALAALDALLAEEKVRRDQDLRVITKRGEEIDRQMRRAEKAEAELAKSNKEYVTGTQRWVDEVCHYRNLAIELGAPPNRMLSKYDRELAERGVDDGWDDANRDQTPELWEQLEAVEAERDALRATLEQIKQKGGMGAARIAEDALAEARGSPP
jgi:hypothetical protein